MGLVCYRQSLGGAERRQPGRGPPGSHFLIPNRLPELPFPLPAGEQRRQPPERGSPRQPARPAAHHPLLCLHGGGRGLPCLPEQLWIQTDRANVIDPRRNLVPAAA